MSKKKHIKGIRIGKGECYWFNELKEKYRITGYVLALEGEDGKWERYSYNNEPESDQVYYFIYQGKKSWGQLKDADGNKIAIKNAILMWKFESGETEGLFFQSDPKKDKLNVLTWEAAYIKPEITQKMIHGLIKLFCEEALKISIEDICSKDGNLEVTSEDEKRY